MIPLRDEVRPRKRPYIVYVIIGLNALIWLMELGVILSRGQGFFFRTFLYQFALVPAELFSVRFLAEVWTFLSSMFMHSAPGPWHLIGNMLFLWVFGDNIEDAYGHGWFVPFYLLCGIVGALLHAGITPNSDIPMLGASAAISGILGAYIVLYPRNRVTSLIFLFVFIRLVSLPSWIFIGIWFLYQLVYAVLSIGAAGGGVAFLAHLGGFLAGLSISFLFRKRLRLNIRPKAEIL